MALTLGRLPALRPGRHVLRRDARTLQVGLRGDPVRLPDVPAVAALLRHLDPTGAGADPIDPVDLDDPDVRDALARLERAGHLCPAAAAPTAAPAGARVGVTVLGAGLAEPVGELLATAGLVRDDEHPEAWLTVSAGPVSRQLADRHVQAGLPHLHVAGLEGAWRVGPFVVPGLTACLRCVDAHESANDPRRPLLLEQAARAARERPEPVDALQARWALTWAMRDLRTYLAGGEPGTWSTTVDLPPPESDHSAPVVQRWLRHPDCGCAWDLLLDLP